MRPRITPRWLARAILTTMLFLSQLWEHTSVSAKNEPGDIAVAAQQGRSRIVGKRPSARISTSRLPSKARAAFGGGDGDTRPVICNAQYAFSPDTEVFGFFPNSRTVELKKPHVMADLIVEACHRYWDSDGGINSEYTYYLRDPYGNIVTEQTGDSFRFDFPADTILGEYTLTIDGAWLDSIGIFVRPFEGPRLELTDPSTGEDRTERIGGSTPGVRNTGVKAHFFGFEPESELEIGLYQVDFNAESLESNLIDSWLSTADSNGEYQETLDFTPATASGEYMLTACDLKECDLAFSLLSSEPFGPPNAIQVPPIAWDLFNLEDAAIVSASPNASNFMRCDGPCSSNSTLATASVPEGSTSLYVQWEYENIPVGANYTRTWSIPGKGEWIRYECNWPGPANGTQRVKLTEPKGLHSGTWEVVVTVEGQEILREGVEVDGNWTYWDPAGVIQRCQ